MANIFKQITENGLRLRIKHNKDTDVINNVVNSNDDLTTRQLNADDITSSALLDSASIHDFCTISSNRHNKYVGFEEMLEDPIIAAAVEMYADDATQYNEKGQIIWAEGENTEAVQAANRLIKVLDLDMKAWQHIYSLCVYGDLYLRLYREGDASDYETMYSDATSNMKVTIKPEDRSRSLEEYIEFVENPAGIFDLQTKDKTAGFIRVVDTQNIKSSSIFNTQPLQTVHSGSTTSFDRMSFIHISLSESINRTPELLKVIDDDDDGTIYKIKSGKSMLADAYPVNQSLKLLEDSLLLNRLTKSAIVRLIEVEVGDMPKPDVNNLLHRLKNNLEQKMSTDVNTGMTKSFNSPGPIDNMVFSATKDGKGHISVSNLGGDVNVKDIMDLDYFNNKKLAALKIPKQFLNFDSSEGLGNGTSLTKISSRYAHTIMRIQNSYTQGITNLINYFFLDKGLDYVNKFTIKMVSPGTVEDNERAERLSSQISQCRDIMDLVGDIDEDKKLDVLRSLISTKLNLPDIADIIKQQMSENQDDSTLNDLEPGTEEIGDLGLDSHSTHNSYSDTKMNNTIDTPDILDNADGISGDLGSNTTEIENNDSDFTIPSIQMNGSEE